MAYQGGFPRASQVVHVARGQYDFAVDGGAVSTIVLTPQKLIPANAVITHGFVETLTAVTGTNAEVAVQVEAADDIVAEAAITGAPWSTTGLHSIIPVATGATAVKTTEARNISAVIGTAAATAGKFNVVLFYTVIDD